LQRRRRDPNLRALNPTGERPADKTLTQFMNERPPARRRLHMSVAKTIEIISSSTESIEAAIREGVSKASETVKGIEGVWIKDTKAVVRGNEIAEWRVTMVLTFIVT
jgi:hypothetical protein